MVRRGLAAVALGLLLAGCAPSQPELPSFTAPVTTASSSGVSLEARAGDLYGCLRQAGLPAVLQNGPTGRPTLVRFDESVPAVWILPSGDNEATAAISSADRRTLLAERPTIDNGPFLFIDGRDETETWTRCLDSSGFDDRLVWDTPEIRAEEKAFEARSVEASNVWARCARENGFPGVIDAQP
ncbi:MAG: hypothetical protein LBI84_01720, partial [Propionibacteriaceae bacterium]|nr:hypothetical protein [Propionibacteriaceae bacterium]